MDTNHILLPTTYFEIQNLIMNVSLNIQMKTTHNKHKMKLVKKNELLLNNYQNNSIFIGNNPNISSNTFSILITFECQNIRLLINSPFWMLQNYIFTALSTIHIKLLFVAVHTTRHLLLHYMEACHNSIKGCK